MALTSRDIALKLVAGMFGAAPGPYLAPLIADIEAKGIEQVAIDIGTTPLFAATYPLTQGGHVFAGSFLAQMVPGYSPSNPSHLFVLNWLADKFDQGTPPGLVILQALEALEAVSPADSVWGAARAQWDHTVLVASHLDTSLNGATIEQLIDAVHAPIFVSAEVNSSTLVLHYSDANGLDAAHPPLATSFTVMVGETARTVSLVSADAGAKTVTLTLSSAVLAGQAVTVAYADPTTGDDARAVQDAFGNDAASLTAHTATNNTPDNNGPVFASASVNGNVLVMTYTDAGKLDAVHVPGAGAFTIKADGSSIAVTDATVDAAAKTITLTLKDAVTDAQEVTVAYADPTDANDTAAIQDALGNDAASLTVTAVTNVSPDISGPAFKSASVKGDTLVMTYTDSTGLFKTGAPETKTFAVKVGGIADTVTAVEVDDVANTVTLTLTKAAAFGEEVTVAYTDPTSGDDFRAIQDTIGNDAPSLPATKVTNDTPDTTAPVFASATVNASTLVMQYTEATKLDADHLPAVGAFTVKVNGTTADVVKSVAVNASAKTVTLTLTTPVIDGQAVTVAYVDKSSKIDDTNAIQDTAGNDAASLSATTVTNVTADVTAPTFVSAVVDGSSLVMTYSDLHNLEITNKAAGSDFTVMVGGVADTVSAVSVSGSTHTVTLTLATPVVNAQAVTVAYKDPTSGNDKAAIQDVAGNDAITLAATTVKNNTAPPDTTAPTFVGSTVDGTAMVVTFNEALDGKHMPLAADFLVKFGSTTVAVDSVALNAGGSALDLTLHTAAVFNQNDVTVSFADAITSDGNAIQDAAGNAVSNVSTAAVINVTPDSETPAFVFAEVTGTELLVHFSDNNVLDTSHLPVAADFVVKVNGSDAAISSISANGALHYVTLTLATAVPGGLPVTLSYTDPTTSDDLNAIQDAAGNDVADIVGVTVTNNLGAV